MPDSAARRYITGVTLGVPPGTDLIGDRDPVNRPTSSGRPALDRHATPFAAVLPDRPHQNLQIPAIYGPRLLAAGTLAALRRGRGELDTVQKPHTLGALLRGLATPLSLQLPSVSYTWDVSLKVTSVIYRGSRWCGGETGLDSRRSRSRIFTCGNRAGRCHWLTGFLGDLQFTPPLHSGVVPYSPRFTLIRSSRPQP
ncbi:hypothetical protein PR048_003374 [Dryococelus australis]|uniref:Uncharacterized protein n=1 Tax=Dryococelus australis TaxID=614101 RepID=A0ABQ9IP88_9NEOP|nr:hypothetical protein PR048_003374 [Dryococelus australis]